MEEQPQCGISIAGISEREKSSCDPENLVPLIKGAPTHTNHAFMISLHSCHTTMRSPSFLPVPFTFRLLQKGQSTNSQIQFSETQHPSESI